jgi:uncharacterized SAM-binding protein YcdF (DUF218 family)
VDSLYSGLKPLVGAMLMPVPVTCLAALCGLVLSRAGYRRAGRGLVAGAGLLILLLAWGPVAEGLLAPLENRYPPMPNPAALANVGAVVVLGGGWWSDPGRPITAQLHQSSALRLFEGLRLLQALPGARLVVSGGSRNPERPPSAWGYAQAARDMGVPAERILVLDTPLDTAQEAYAVRDALGTGERLVLVTSAAHMPRALRHFQAVGLDPIPAPTQYLSGRGPRTSLLSWLPTAENLVKSERAWYEYLGLLAWRWDHPG